MAFPSLIRRASAPAKHRFAANDVHWGVRRRRGFSEFDDPAAHRGLTQHAFLVGYDRIALCGYRPVGRRDRTVVPLAAATPGGNPMCAACARAVRSPEPRARSLHVALPPEPLRPLVNHYRPRGLDVPSLDRAAWPMADLAQGSGARLMLMLPVEPSSQRNDFSPARMPLQLEAGELVGATSYGADDSTHERVGAGGARSARRRRSSRAN